LGLLIGGSVTIPDVTGLEAALGAKADDAATTSALAGKQPLHAILTAVAGLTGAANKGLYFTGASALATYDLVAFGRTWGGLADAAAGRTALALGSLATASSINGSNWSGTDLAVADGGTGASSLTGIIKGNGASAFTAVTAPSGAIVGTTDTQGLTNKRVTLRKVAAGSTSGTLTPNTDTTDIFTAFGLTGGITMASPSGTPVDGDVRQDQIQDNGTSRAISWNAAYRAMNGVTLPVATIANKIIKATRQWNAAASKWDVLSVAVQA
jgi:hypothetical protein